MTMDFVKMMQLRRLSAIAHDLCAALLAWVLAFYLRFNFQVPDSFYASILTNGIWVLPIQVFFFFQFGLYRGVWRFASLPDLKRIINSVVVSALVIMVFKIMLTPPGVIPRTVHILDPILLIMMMGGSRFVYRAWKDHRLYALSADMGKPVLIVGAGELAINLLNDLARSKEWRVVGMLDNEKHMLGREIRGVKVIGALDELGSIAQSMAVQHVILALSHNQLANKKQVIALANQFGLSVLTVPTLEDLISGRSNVSQVRKVEVEDLLGRDPVALDENGLHDLIFGKVVLITGAGGSIGSELCRQVLRYEPKVLVLFDISEYALYLLEQSLLTRTTATNMIFLVGDIKQTLRVTQVLHQYRPELVFHAAAYKHVPLMEHDNVAEALTNNVLGTYRLAQACQEAGISKFVLISTDKAVNPTNVMGASKRLAEMVCQGLQAEVGTRFVVVRFGNVLGSSGSVIPKFREQIAKGGPVTVTHPEITRYFMSIPEAAQLVMQAGLMGKGGEIYVLDMGDSVKIVDLARDMIRLSGFHEEDISIQYTGLRPGEKLYEELLADDENTIETHHRKLRIAIARNVDQQWMFNLIAWIETLTQQDENAIKQSLKFWVEEYTGDIHAASKEAVSTLPVAKTIH